MTPTLKAINWLTENPNKIAILKAFSGKNYLLASIS